MRPSGWARGLIALGILAASGVVRGQCPPIWQSASDVPGANGNINSMVMWDPDGPGPRQPVLVATGSFTAIGGTALNQFGVLENGAWTTLPGAKWFGALVVRPDGSLVATGAAAAIAPSGAAVAARWDGSSWSALGSVGWYTDSINAAANLPDGGLVAVGALPEFGNVAKWDGTAWSAVGSGTGILNGSVATNMYAVAVMNDGSIVVGGHFTQADGQPASNIARWNGQSWSDLGGGARVGDPGSGFVSNLAVMSNGDLVAAGQFTTIGGQTAPNLARWNGTAWSPIGGGPMDQVYNTDRALLPLANGELLAGGDFATSNGTAFGIARWDGAAWNALGSGLSGNSGAPYTIVRTSTGTIFAGGLFTRSGTQAAFRIARYDGVDWAPMGVGFDGPVRAAANGPGGMVVIGGEFTTTPSGPADHIAMWTGSGWARLGQGLSWSVYAIGIGADGSVYAGGIFTSAGGSPATRVAKWDGTVWTPLTTGVNGQVNALAVAPNGNVYVGGQFTIAGGVTVSNVARWDGVQWFAMGSGSPVQVQSVAVLPNGDVVVGAAAGSIGGVFGATHAARWDGAAWHAMASGPGGPPNSMAIDASGTLLAAWNGGVSKWTGTAWVRLGAALSPNVTSVLVLPSGNIVAGSDIGNVNRWNGTGWVPELGRIQGPVYALARLGTGEDYLAGGDFSMVGTTVSSKVVFNRLPTGTAPPVIAAQPADVLLCRYPYQFSLSVGAAGQSGEALSYRWRKNGVAMPDSAARTSGTTSAVLHIVSATNADSGVYDVVVSSLGGCVVSRAVTVRSCPGDFDCSGHVDVMDIFAFINAWLGGDPAANVAGLPESEQNVFTFIARWFEGCG